MSTKHTQGEWVVDAENNLIHASGNPRAVICSFHDSIRNPTVAVHACLIASAPELFEALELIASAENSALDLAYCKGIARAAIAKATGGAP